MERMQIRIPRHNFYLLLFGLFFSLLFVSCNSGIEYSADTVLPAEGWNKDSVLAYNYTNTDTSARHDLYFYIRHTTQYPHANIYLFVEILAPAGNKITDTVNFMLASPQGEWYGRGFTTSRQLLLPYHSDFQFLQLGNYTFRIRHGMRYDLLEGVEDMGLQVYEHLEGKNGKK